MTHYPISDESLTPTRGRPGIPAITPARRPGHHHWEIPMRMRSWVAAAAVLSAVVAGPGRATAQPSAEPTIEVRLRSVNDLLERFEYVGGLVNQEDAARQVRDLARALSD